MKPKPITGTPSYNFAVAFNKILHSLLSFCFLLSFVLALYYGKLSIIDIYHITLILIIIGFFKIIRRAIYLLCAQYIENLPTQKSLDFGLNICNLHLKFNLILYFMSGLSEFNVKSKRFFNSKFSQHNGSIYFYDLVLLLFYYPLTRLLYCYFLLVRVIFSDEVTQSISKTVEFYIILFICSWPFIFHGFLGYHFLCIYLFLLFFLFPILNLIEYLILLIYTLLFDDSQPLSNFTYVNEFIAFFINNGVSFTYIRNSFGLAYPTVFTLTLMRNDISLLSKLHRLYDDNILIPTESLQLMQLFMSYGIDNKSACVGKHYYNNAKIFIVSYNLDNLENDKFISYSGYIALYNVLSRNWYDAWLLEFFISLHNSHQSEDDFEPIKPELLDQLNQSIANHLHIMQTVFKLIWDIEKDGGLNPIHVIPHLQGQLPSNLDYPINKYSILLFGGFNRLDGLFITPDIYEKNLKNMRNGKSLNHLLEAKIVDFFVSNHVNIEKTLSTNGHGGIFQDNGAYLIARLIITQSNDIDSVLNMETFNDCKNLMRLKQNVAMMAYDSLFFDDELRIREFIIKRLGESVATWRKEWKDQQSSAFSKPKL